MLRRQRQPPRRGEVGVLQLRGDARKNASARTILQRAQRILVAPRFNDDEVGGIEPETGKARPVERAGVEPGGAIGDPGQRRACARTALVEAGKGGEREAAGGRRVAGGGRNDFMRAAGFQTAGRQMRIRFIRAERAAEDISACILDSLISGTLLHGADKSAQIRKRLTTRFSAGTRREMCRGKSHQSTSCFFVPDWMFL